MENTNINDATIKRSNIPNNWSYCFNSNCKHCNECIHFRSSVALDSSRTQGNAIFPTALRADGSCDHFKPVRMVRLASGFKQLFEDVKLRDASNLRLLMRKYFGGTSMYYRYHYGKSKLVPEQQEWIKQLFAQYDYTNVVFDNSKEEIDFL
ncbi:DUF6078 family protein [Leyella stercorea]